MSASSTCLVCGKELTGRADQKFCSTACKQAWYRWKKGFADQAVGPFQLHYVVGTHYEHLGQIASVLKRGLMDTLDRAVRVTIEPRPDIEPELVFVRSDPELPRYLLLGHFQQAAHEVREETRMAKESE